MWLQTEWIPRVSEELDPPDQAIIGSRFKEEVYERMKTHVNK